MNDFIGTYLIKRPYLEALSEGHFAFGYNVGTAWIIGGALLLIGVAVFLYIKTTRPVTNGWKVFFITLRSATLLLLAFCLLEPSVLISEVVPQETYLAVLVDDSKSMGIQDEPGSKTRHQQALDLLYNDEKVIDRLSDTFQVRSYRFSDVAQRLSGPDALLGEGGTSSLAAGMNHVLGELSSLPLAGLVLVSDGADNSDLDPLQSAQALADKDVPIYAVGVGREEIAQDVNIVDVSAAKSLLEGSIYTVQVAINQQGYGGQLAHLSIESDDDIVAEQTVTLPNDGTAKRYTLELSPEREEILVYHLNVEEKQGETIVENNHYTFFVDNRKKEPLDILYIEGQPRNEYKFIRRALEGDPSLRLVTYLQTGPQKFLRQGINSPTELSKGFPQTADELFKYEAVIFGDVGESFFSEKQLQILDDFVAKRGGGFLVIGGVEESFLDSPVADILPVELVREERLPSYLQGGPRRGDHPTGSRFSLALTKEGEFSPILRLDSNDDTNRHLWRDMPQLEGINVTGRAKPGATVLAEHPNLSLQNTPLPVMVIQRYGSGRSMILTSASTWRWQMLMPHEDQSHERLWRQILRWLATPSESRLTITLDQENYDAGETVQVTAKLLDREFEADNNGILYMKVTDPQGNVQEMPMTWDIDNDGTYKQTLTVEQQGIYDLTVNVASDAEGGLNVSTPILVTPSRREFLQAGMDSGLLQRLASTTHGKFYTANDAGRVVDDITFSPNAYSREETQSLWDQPLFLYLIVAFVCIEWMARRYKGLS